MRKRLDLHKELVKFYEHAYFQPPSNIQMVYPCIVYNKGARDRKYSNNGIYLALQLYEITLIERDPDSEVANAMEEYFDHCTITQNFNTDNLNHTTINLYY